MNALGAALLLPAGIVAGVIGTAGGITSLVAYPALLAAGLPPLVANTTGSVALLGSGLASATRARADVAGRGRVVRRAAGAFAVLSLAGAVLLVRTPAGLFDAVVPFLVATGALVLLVQPAVTRGLERRGRRPPRALLAVGAGAVALYNGYFGAGSGILLIALLLLSIEPVLHRANALKNVILVVADVLPAVLFVLLGTVVWAAAVPLGVGAAIGGLIGPAVARRVPAAVLRVLIACCGFLLAGVLLVRR